MVKKKVVRKGERTETAREREREVGKMSVSKFPSETKGALWV